MVHYYKESDCPGASMAPSRKQQVIDLLKSLETKDPVPLAYVNPNKYIQHNLQVGSGPAGVAALIKNMPPDASVNTIRVLWVGPMLRVFSRSAMGVGFHTFRHTYRAWLDETGAPVGGQQKLMRHAHVSTTMDQYGNASALAKRKANRPIVQRLLQRPANQQVSIQ